jgi:hypothetical protein
VKRIERAAARRLLLSRLLQEEATLECFAATRRARADLGLHLPRTTITAWHEDADALEQALLGLRPSIEDASEIERRNINGLLAQLDLPLAWRGPSAWLPEWVSAAFQQWTSWVDGRDPGDLADIRTLVLAVYRTTATRVAWARDNSRAALGLRPSAGPIGPISVNASFAGQAREIVAGVLDKMGAAKEEREAAMAEFDSRMRIADHWSTPALDLLENEAADPHLSAALPPIPPVYLGALGASAARRRADEIAEEVKALIDAYSEPVDGSTVTEGRRSLIERDVELWYRNKVNGASIKSLSVAEFGADDRRTEVKRRIARAAEVLGVGEPA